MVAPGRPNRIEHRLEARAQADISSSRLLDEYVRHQDETLVRIGNPRDGRYQTADGGQVRLDDRGRPTEICGPRRSDGTRALITGIQYHGDTSYATHMSYGTVGRNGRNVHERWRLVPNAGGPAAGGRWTTAAEGARPESGRHLRCGPVTVARHGVIRYDEIDRTGTTHAAVRDLRNDTVFVPRDGRLNPVGDPGERLFETSDGSRIRFEHGRPLEQSRPVEILGPVRSNGTRAMITGIRYDGDSNYATHMSYGTLDGNGNRVLRENWRLVANEGGPSAGGLWTTAPEGAQPTRGRQQRCGPVTVSRDGVINYNDTSTPGRPLAALRDTHNRTIVTPYRRAEAPPPRPAPDADAVPVPPPPRPAPDSDAVPVLPPPRLAPDSDAIPVLPPPRPAPDSDAVPVLPPPRPAPDSDAVPVLPPPRPAPDSDGPAFETTLSRLPQPTGDNTHNDDGSHTWRDANGRVAFVQPNGSEDVWSIHRDGNGDPHTIGFGEAGQSPIEVLHRSNNGRWYLIRGSNPPVELRGVNIDDEGNVTINHSSGRLERRYRDGTTTETE